MDRKLPDHNRLRHGAPETVRLYDNSMECTPDALFKNVASCFGFLLTCTFVASLGILAAGMLLIAQHVDKMTNSENVIMIRIA